jgi:hypothetical protein
LWVKRVHGFADGCSDGATSVHNTRPSPAQQRREEAGSNGVAQQPETFRARMLDDEHLEA